MFSPRGQSSKNKKDKRDTSSTPMSSPATSPVRGNFSSQQIQVEVVDPLNPKKEDTPVSTAVTTGNNPTITLEVPTFQFGKCLSPIKELPSPMPTPIMSPMPCRSSPVPSLPSQDDDSICSNCGGCCSNEDVTVVPASPTKKTTTTDSLSVASNASSGSTSSETSSRRTYFQQTYHKNSARVEEPPTGIEMTVLSHQDTMADTPEITPDSASAAPVNYDTDESVEAATIDNLYTTTSVVVAAVVQRRPSLLASLQRGDQNGVHICPRVSPTSINATTTTSTSSSSVMTTREPAPPLPPPVPVIMVRNASAIFDLITRTFLKIRPTYALIL